MQEDKCQLKPMLTEEQLVNHIRNKGVMFRYQTEEEAVNYLKFNNNYFKLASYRKNYCKYQGGIKDGMYIDLDFAYLRDLAIIDMKLRYVLIQMALDIEHYSKLNILREIEKFDEDGYSICDEFVKSLSKKQKEMLEDEIERNRNTIYCGDLFAKYPMHFPVWVFLELIPFGRLLSFYRFCANRFNNSNMIREYYMLLSCKDVRNAAAHSSCILNDLHVNTQQHAAQYQVMNALSGIKEISKDSREKRMSNARVQEVVTLLYTHKCMVTSEGVHNKAIILLQDYRDRMLKNTNYYENNDLIKANFTFLRIVIDNWFRKL